MIFWRLRFVVQEVDVLVDGALVGDELLMGEVVVDRRDDDGVVMDRS